MENAPKGAEADRLHPIRYMRGLIAGAFGVTAEHRTAIVGAMLTASLAESVGYWFQLILSMAIATLGLVLSSSGVVIAAMLIAPLMGPIVQIAMALAIGSPVMAIRASTRAIISIVVVVSSATLITLVLPFYEVTPEIAARTSPTVLDLIIAGCCALAGAFATVRPGSETTGTAAGTAIGIALVPPLCVIGFGLGSGRPDIAAGASLLFTANLCAILLFALLMFILLGFDLVDVSDLENRSLSDGREAQLTFSLARRLKGVIGSRYSVVLRVLMPLALMVSVYLPLRQALEEVTWQVRVRSAIQRILQDSPLTRDAVRSVITVEKRAVAVRLVVIAESAEAARLRNELQTQIAAASGVVPTVELVTVPDFEALQAAASAWERAPASELAHPLELERLRHALAEVLGQVWPVEAAGPLLSWGLELAGEQASGLQVVHLGLPLGPAGESLLSQKLSAELGAKVLVLDLPLSMEAQTLVPGQESVWLVELARRADAVRRYAGLVLHVQYPSEITPPGGALPVSEPARQELERVPQDRKCSSVGEQWRVQLSTQPCPRTSTGPEPIAAEPKPLSTTDKPGTAFPQTDGTEGGKGSEPATSPKARK